MNSLEYSSIDTISDSLCHYRENGANPGYFTGWDIMHEYYSVKMGCCTDWTGQPTMGKTALLLNVLYNLSKLYDLTHFMWMPDAGSINEVYADLIQIHTGKTFDKRYPNYITDKEYKEALPFIYEHFFLIKRKSKQSVNFDSFIKDAIEFKNVHNFNTATIDSWNYLSKTSTKSDVKDLAEQLALRNQFSDEFKIHFNTIIHPSKPDKEDRGKAVTSYDLMGGSEWYNNAKSQLSILRPDKNTNETEIYSLKQKPRVVGKEGKFSLYFDVPTLRFYEDKNGIITFAHPQSKEAKQSEIEYQSRYEKEPEIGSDEDLPF